MSKNPMSIAVRLLRLRSAYIVSVTILAVSAVQALGAQTDYAVMMSGASTSLLLDVGGEGERMVSVGERGHILYSVDLGGSWVQATVPTSVMLTRVFFINSRLGWAIGHDGNILVSRDGGVNWELQRDGVTDQERINEDRLSRALQREKTLRSQLSESPEEEGGLLLEQLQSAENSLDKAREIVGKPAFAPPLMDVWFSNEHLGWASGAFGTLMRTMNGGRAWEDWGHKVGNEEELHLNAVVGDAAGNLYMASEWGYVFRSSSGGEFWEAVETGYDGSFFGVLVNPATGSVFAYGLLGTIYRSSDQGKSWQELESNTGATLFGAVGTADGALVFVGLNGTVVFSRDDGDSLVRIPQNHDRDLYGVAPIENGRYIVTGKGGSSELTADPERDW